MATEQVRLLDRDVTTIPTGSRTLVIGGRTFKVPINAQTARGPEHLTYVRANGRVYCVTDRGAEIIVPNSVQGALAKAYFPSSA